jgi:trans-2,3-dihydro-3-hydroxyanthranilate isomerase
LRSHVPVRRGCATSSGETARATLPFDLVDVFAARPLEGNLLVVVHNADEIGDEVMQKLATRFRLSETSFVQASDRPGADYRHRIFTIAQELPFAGHPSIGTAAVVVRRRGDRAATVVQQTVEGLQRIEVELEARSQDSRYDRARVSLQQSMAMFGAEIQTRSLMAGFGLETDDAHPSLLAQMVSTGLPTLVIPLRDAAALERIAVDWPAVEAAVGGVADVSFLNLYVVAERAPGAWSARCFGHDIAGGEDPATGSAAGPLGSYLQATVGGERFEIEQGVEMGEPSHISVSVANGRPTIAGEVQVLGSGTIGLSGISL